jgi:hypothetical protein
LSLLHKCHLNFARSLKDARMNCQSPVAVAWNKGIDFPSELRKT